MEMKTSLTPVTVFPSHPTHLLLFVFHHSNTFIIIWNALPDSICKAQSLDLFKKLLKSHLFTAAYIDPWEVFITFVSVSYACLWRMYCLCLSRYCLRSVSYLCIVTYYLWLWVLEKHNKIKKMNYYHQTMSEDESQCNSARATTDMSVTLSQTCSFNFNTQSPTHTFPQLRKTHSFQTQGIDGAITGSRQATCIKLSLAAAGQTNHLIIYSTKINILIKYTIYLYQACLSVCCQKSKQNSDRDRVYACVCERAGVSLWGCICYDHFDFGTDHRGHHAHTHTHHISGQWVKWIPYKYSELNFDWQPSCV